MRRMPSKPTPMRLRLVASSVMLLMLSGCNTTQRTPGGIAIETLCREWGRSLPTRSRQDTQQTQKEIGQAYNAYEAACKDKLP